MSWLVVLTWLLVGAGVGGLASVLQHVEATRAVVLNAAVGAVGAVLAGWLATSETGNSDITGRAAGMADAGVAATHFNAGVLVIGFLGAFCLLTVVHFLRNRSWRH